MNFEKGNEVTLGTLMEHINSVYTNIKTGNQQLKFDKVEDFITDDSKAAEFIRVILHDDDFQSPDEGSELYEVAKVRARHSVITFLIGLVFLEFNNFEEKIGKAFFPNEPNAKDLVTRMWMITALYHDYGYFVDDLKNGKVNLKKGIKYYLLDDKYKQESLDSLSDYCLHHQAGLAYTYDEIEAYDEYARIFHQNTEGKEKVDHGILGGVRIFQRLLSRAEKQHAQKVELITIKTSCLAIAQHNIFKSPSIEKDKEYGKRLKKLYYDSNFVICDDTPLLFLLCLVDTFECVKKLSKKENKADYFETETVLSSIRISVSLDEIVIDYSELERRVSAKNSGLQDRYLKYKGGLFGIETWTAIRAMATSDNKPIISIKPVPFNATSNLSIAASTDEEATYV